MTKHDDQSVDGSSIVGFSRPGSGKSTLIGKISNFSVQYNLSAASIAVAVMVSHNDTEINSGSDSGVLNNTATPLTPDFHEADWVKRVLLGAVFLGAVLGMITMGYLGDMLGRRKAMLVTLSFVVLGALGSGLASWGSDDAVFSVICFCRLIVGVGVGGIYPLSATSSSEAKSEVTDDTDSVLREEAADRVGYSFFWQMPGQFAPYVVALILIAFHDKWGSFSTGAQFRLIYALGAIPAAAVLLLQWRAEESKDFEDAKQRTDQSVEQFSPLKWARAHPQWVELRDGLIGTAGTWFIYDVSYYGTVIFTPHILKSIFGHDETLTKMSYQAIILGLAGIPACILGIEVLKRKGCFFLNFWGFILMAFMFALLGTVNLIADGHSSYHYPLFIIFIMLSFALNMGPPVATFVLPALCFPTEVKSSFHGISAAAAKVGAAAGTFMYKPMADATSLTFLMYFQVCSVLFFSQLAALVVAVASPFVVHITHTAGRLLAPGRSSDLLLHSPHRRVHCEEGRRGCMDTPETGKESNSSTINTYHTPCTSPTGGASSCQRKLPAEVPVENIEQSNWSVPLTQVRTNS